MFSYKWKPIEDLPDSRQDLRSIELKHLALIWKEQAVKLKNPKFLQQFNERLRREWAIETGIIENLYKIDRGTTQLLIEKGIETSLIPFGSTDKPADEIVPILKDQESVLDGIFDFIAHKRDLSTSFIKELHQVLTRHQDTVVAQNGFGNKFHVSLIKGAWKKQPNNPTRQNGELHEYCPPEHVDAEMDRLISLHQQHLRQGVPPEVEASWLHHRFTQIHPFVDGNGRIARALASLVFIREGWFPLVVHRDFRDQYIKALEMADRQEDLRPLVNLFSDAQKKAFVRALSISEDILRGQEPLQKIYDAVEEKLKSRRITQYREREKVFKLSQVLEKLTTQKLEVVAKELTQKLKAVDRSYVAKVDVSRENNSHWFWKQIIIIAKKLDYYADTRTYRAWVRLKIKEVRQAELVFSFHSLGVDFLGIMAISAFLEFRDKTEKEETSIEGLEPISREIFQFTYAEDKDSLVQRFQKWISNVLTAGLDQWRKQL